MLTLPKFKPQSKFSEDSQNSLLVPATAANQRLFHRDALGCQQLISATNDAHNNGNVHLEVTTIVDCTDRLTSVNLSYVLILVL